MGSQPSASVGWVTRSGKAAEEEFVRPNAEADRGAASFQARAPPRRLTPLPLAMRRALTLALGALRTMG